jgi:flagellar basal body rod protein FlgG
MLVKGIQKIATSMVPRLRCKVAANNLANAETAGFRKTRSFFVTSKNNKDLMAS